MGSVTKPISKVLDKIVPNEIKPALPFLAAAAPFLAPGLLAGLGSLGGVITNPTLQGAIGGGLLNLGSQASQEGASKYGINPLSLGLASLGGALAAPGSAGEFANMGPQMVDIDTGLLVAAKPQGILENMQSIGANLGQKGATAFDTAREALGKGDIFSKEFLTAAVPGQIGAAGDLAYFQAAKALDEFDKQQASLGAMGVANTEGRKAAIRKAMGLAGYTNDEIDTTLLKFNFATGGRVGYQLGGGTKPPSMPMNPDMLAMAIFGKSYDELTYTQKSAINDMLPNKKAEGGIMNNRIGYKSGGMKSRESAFLKEIETRSIEHENEYGQPLPIEIIQQIEKQMLGRVRGQKAEGGIMNLGGLEMDLRAKGGFVPIGRKEKADDVPARLSKNEFVMTANAVRGAGKGDVKKGAKRMYNLMRQYEAMA